ncbi:amidohydrolase family protein [Streptomyces sp. AcE210]|uniref:amidohydrolase family protein n=1 Tax=Streptomyces sp. AcE210 TaxID=2292703 RepID=UPI000E304810|nr:amidohydrolase family protein [Streptomyces sp. AcE210]RFC70257.1 amidohydrolase family protein [Streptomyces sp. AcE210]
MSSRKLITAARVVTGPDGRCVEDGAVLTDGDTVVAAGRRTEVEALADERDERIALPGTTALPGLFDAHVHLVFDAGTDPVGTLEGQDDEALLAVMRERAARLVASGVTTVRDLGDRGRLTLRLREEIESGAVPGPRIVAATTPVTPKGGHCWFLGGEVGSERELRDLVRRNAELGADVIKVMATGGALTRGGPATWQAQFGVGELAVVVEEARGVGLPVAAHAHGTAGIEAAVTAGVDTLEHCTWMTEDGNDLRDDVLDAIVERGIRVCPTVSPHWRMLPTVFGAERAERLFGQVRTMAERGVRFIAGTDAGVQRAGFDGLRQSLTFFEHIGMPAPSVLDMATTEAADALGAGGRAGLLAPGRPADLIAVSGDPRAGLEALTDLRFVMSRGELIPPQRAV